MNHPFRRIDLDRSNAVPDVAQPLVPDALIRLHYAIESMRRHQEPSVLQLIAATTGEGTSTIAGMLARIAAASRERSVLLLDCSGTGIAPHGLWSVVDAFNAGLPLKQTATSPAHDGLHRLARLTGRPGKLMALPSNGLRELFDTLRQGFDLVLLDMPAAADTPAAGALARHCDGTILVVQAERATIDSVQAMRRDIELSGGQVVGTVLNRQQQHLPSWLHRRLQ